MIRVVTFQGISGRWYCGTGEETFEDSATDGLTILEAQQSMIAIMVGAGANKEDILFDEPKWRRYNYNEVMGREPLQKIEDFRTGQVLEISPRSYTKEPCLGIITKCIQEVGNDKILFMNVEVPGHHPLTIEAQNQWDLFFRQIRILGDKEDFITELITQRLLGIK